MFFVAEQVWIQGVRGVFCVVRAVFHFQAFSCYVWGGERRERV